MKQLQKNFSYRSLPAAAAMIVSLFLGGCANSRGALCTPDDRRNGSVCYDGINFGRNDDPLFRRGIEDGCRTAKGYFRKAYDLSAVSENYRRGWESGRARCRMEQTPPPR